MKMRSKELAKEEIRNLLEKHESLRQSGKTKSYNEEMTKKDFILPLFRALGWSVEDGQEVTAEEQVSRGRGDYVLKIEGIPKLFLEAKAIGADIDRIKFAEQAINYAWHKGSTWAVLTDFENVKVFNAELKMSNPLQNTFFSLSHRQFLERIDQLWLLSRESMENGSIDREAEKWGNKAKKIPVDRQLLNDLTRFREALTKNILKNNAPKNLTSEELDEAVQRILDRLIFIRTLEDRQLEAPALQSLIRERKDKMTYKKVNNLFKRIDNEYDSKLFTSHLCDDLAIDDEVLNRIIDGLFKTPDNSVHYDFSAIDADVLGNMYEQYLCHILTKTAKRARLTKGDAHRKARGIYYTPPYIVDYIVKNTLGELNKKRNLDMRKVKILDPACGSGSFLMKSFDYILSMDKKKNETTDHKPHPSGATTNYEKKIQILKENIFGVDLDPKAVEIAGLNLLLKAAEKKHRLPKLDDNIKVGNSLIDESKIDPDKAFIWERQFKKILDEGGFDVIIGNPPYGAQMEESQKRFLKEKYPEEKTRNTASYFILKSLELVRKGGYVAYIVPKQLTYISSWEYARRKLLEMDVIKVIDASEAFPEVELEQVIFIAKKSQRKSKKISVGFSEKNKINESKSSRKYFNEKRFPLWITNENQEIFENVLRNSVPLSSIANVNWGAPTAKLATREKLADSISCIRGREIKRYRLKPEHFIRKKDVIHSYLVKGEKLIFQRIVSRHGKVILANYRDARIVGTYSEKEIYADKTVTMIWDSKVNLKYILGLLNSRLISWFAHRYLWNRSQLTMEFMYEYARNFPVHIPESKNDIEKVASLTDKMLTTIKNISSIGDKITDQKSRLEKEAAMLDHQIDLEVYRIYDLTNDQIRLVEEPTSSKS